MSKKERAGCPLWKAPCKEHGCDWYIQMQGKNPNTGEQINKFGCAIAWLPILMIENSQQQRITAASVQDFRNHMVDANNQLLRLAGNGHDDHSKR